MATAASAACDGGGLKNYMFQETFFQNLTPWTQLHFIKTGHFSSMLDLHLKEDHRLESPSDDSFSMFTSDPNSPSNGTNESRGSTSSTNSPEHWGKSRRDCRQHGHSDSFSSMSSESLSMCTEGLGFESCDDMEEDASRVTSYISKSHIENLKCDNNNNNHHHCGTLGKRSETVSRGSLPPPISCIGKNGKPWVCFKSYRDNGRFILKLIRIPNQELLHSYRENGHFKMEFIVSDNDDDNEILEEDETSEEKNDNDGDRRGTMQGEEGEREEKKGHDN